MGHRICVGVTGSIAAYRSPDLVKELVARGHEVQVVLTSAAENLVSPRVLETFAGRPLLNNAVFSDSHFGTDHISTARWADLFLIYGATADFLARYATGLASDFLNLQLIATRSPVLLAPAMNPAMWEHASVQENVRVLEKRGVRLVGPIAGKVACGESGVGHVADLQDILRAAESWLGESLAQGPLHGKRILISAGPMRTTFDPVRYVQNRSSGLMGLELARAAKKLGAQVQVLLGPVEDEMVAKYAEFHPEHYEGAREYREKLDRMFPSCNAFLSAAAVLDFDLVPSDKKLDRSRLTGGELTLRYEQVPDMVAAMAALRRPGQKVIAFAAETGTDPEIVTRATAKMDKKHVDALIANPVRPGLGPEARENQVWILKPGAKPLALGPAPKSELARPILEALFGSA